MHALLQDVITTFDDSVVLLQSSPHKWGPGGILHILTQDCITFCGHDLDACPGILKRGSINNVTCKACIKSIHRRENDARRAAEEDRKEQESQEREAEEERQWRQAYNEYMKSPTWFAKRQLIMQRANGWCEGCGQASAVQVHHIWYPKDYPRQCLAGSPVWLKKEKLWSLVAVCLQCHQDLHPNKYQPTT